MCVPGHMRPAPSASWRVLTCRHEARNVPVVCAKAVCQQGEDLVHRLCRREGARAACIVGQLGSGVQIAPRESLGKATVARQQ